MPARNARFYALTLIAVDVLILLAAFGLAYILRVQFDPRPLLAEVYATDFFLASLSIVPIWVVVFASLGLYTSLIYTRRLAEWGRLFIGSFIGILVVVGYEFITDEPFLPARLVAVYAFIGSFLLLLVGRELVRFARTLLYRYGVGVSRVLIIGNSTATLDIASLLGFTPRSGFDIVAIAGPQTVVPAELRATHYKTVEHALVNLEEDRITTIIQTDLYDSVERNQKILGAAQTRHINYSFIPGEAEFYSGKNTVDIFLGYPIISVHQTPLIGWGQVAKRILDVIATLLAMPLLLPIFLLLLVLQKLFNPGPVFYVSDRLTRYSKRFKLYKFRSMRPEFGTKDATEEFKAMGREDLAREYEKFRKVRNDPRITWFGKFLRISSLDELPQIIINVLRGDLSLVGPRPILPQELKLYRDKSSLLHSVKSGVTGLWQVSGRNNLSFDQRVELELYYAQNWSFWLDIKIMFKTIKVLFLRGGAR